MFVFTMKFNRKVAVAIIVAIALILAGIVLIAGGSDSRGETSRLSVGRGIKTNEDRLDYLKTLGWECEEEPYYEQTVVIPREFNDIFSEYNELQIRQGFDLSQYCGLEATMYRYKITNYPSAGENVLAQLIILNYQVIGGDVHSTSVDGFMHGIK